MNNKIDLNFVIQGIDKIFAKYPGIKVCNEKFKTFLDIYDGEDWKNYIDLNEKEYIRKMIHQTEHYQLMLINWNARQSSAIHNHPSAGCLMKILKGKLREDRFSTDDLSLIGSCESSENGMSYIEDSLGYHSITNVNDDKPTFSLHLYSPPGFELRKFYPLGK